MAIILLQSIMFFLRVLEFLIFIRVIMSWLFMIGSTNSFSKLVYDLTEFIFVPARNLLNRTPLSKTFIDFSPILACLAIEFLKLIVVNIFMIFFM